MNKSESAKIIEIYQRNKKKGVEAVNRVGLNVFCREAKREPVDTLLLAQMIGDVITSNCGIYRL